MRTLPASFVLCMRTSLPAFGNEVMNHALVRWLVVKKHFLLPAASFVSPYTLYTTIYRGSRASRCFFVLEIFKKSVLLLISITYTNWGFREYNCQGCILLAVTPRGRRRRGKKTWRSSFVIQHQQMTSVS